LAATALNKHKGLQQFFKYLVDEDEMDRSPMERVKQPPLVRGDRSLAITIGDRPGSAGGFLNCRIADAQEMPR
jgi:hypothetical protein